MPQYLSLGAPSTNNELFVDNRMSANPGTFLNFWKTILKSAWFMGRPWPFQKMVASCFQFLVTIILSPGIQTACSWIATWPCQVALWCVDRFTIVLAFLRKVFVRVRTTIWRFALQRQRRSPL